MNDTLHVSIDWMRFRRDVVIDRRRVAYIDIGEGPRTCLLIHGMGASWQHWLETIPALLPTHRVIAIDLPGFGDSELPLDCGMETQMRNLGAFCDRLELGSVDVIGHSMGTLVACEFAARYPECMRRLVLTGGPILSVVNLFHSPLQTLRRTPSLWAFLVEAATAGISVPAFIKRWIVSKRWARKIAFAPYTPHPERLSPAIVAGVLSSVGAPGVFPTLRQGFGYDLRPAVHGVRCPTLLIGGELDKVAPECDVRAFASGNGAVQRVVMLADTGHWPMLERPDEFNAIVLEFFS